MRFAEILRENTDLLYQILVTVQGNADADEKPVYLHFNGIKNPKPNVINLDLNRLMTNAGAQQFTFDTFNNAYDQDNRIQKIVKQFDKDGIELKTDQQMTLPADQEKRMQDYDAKDDPAAAQAAAKQLED